MRCSRRARRRNSFEATAIIDAILGLSRALGLPVIAEGVETEQQRSFLAKTGCGIQGYLIGRPEPIAHYQHLVTAIAACAKAPSLPVERPVAWRAQESRRET